jgi:hypothetical protein
MKYIALFVLIQLINIPLTVLGWFVGLQLVYGRYYSFLWLWENDDDVELTSAMSPWRRYVYLSWRNPVANLRHVPGVSGKGRPLYYRSWLIKGKQFYVKCGWMSDGYPALSAGAGRGY